MRKLLIIVGNRPQYIKLGILIPELKRKKIRYIVIDTGQHYNNNLSNFFFKNFGFKPKINLKIGSAINAIAVSKIINKLTIFLKSNKFKDILVFGDTNTTIATSLVSAFHYYNLYHIESGERTYTRKEFPEEINRIVTDNLSSTLFACSKTAYNNLKKEGFNKSRIFFTGDIMYDLFLKAKKKINRNINLLNKFSLKKNSYCLATIHRAENSRENIIYNYLKILDNLKYKTIFFTHPRTEKIINKLKWKPKKNLILHKPVDYYDMMYYLSNSKIVFTDSGGLKREAFFAKKFSVNPMSGNPVWPEINKQNKSITVDPKNFKRILKMLKNKINVQNFNFKEFGKGDASKKIVNIIAKKLREKKQIINWK